MASGDKKFLLIAGVLATATLVCLGFFLVSEGAFDSQAGSSADVRSEVSGASVEVSESPESTGELLDTEFRFPFDESLAGLVEELRAAIYANDWTAIEQMLKGNKGLLISSIAMCLEIVETDTSKRVPLTALKVLKQLWKEDPEAEQILLNQVLARLFEVLKSTEHTELKADLLKMIARKGYFPARDHIRNLAFDRTQELNVQLAAISVLDLVCDDGCIPELLALLGEVTDSVVLQRAIILILAKFESEGIVDYLVEMARLESTRKGVLQEIIKTLGLLGDNRATELLNSLAANDILPIWLRAEAIRSLYLVASPEAVEHLTNIFLTDLDKNLRFDALHKVGRLSGELPEGDLKKKIHGQLLALLNQENSKRNQELAARSLIYSGDVEHIDTIMESLRNNDTLDLKMLYKYAAHGKEGYVAKLTEVLASEESERMKGAILDTLGRSQDPIAVPSILEVLRNVDENDSVKEKAAYALAWIKDESSLPDLKNLAIDNPRTEARVAAVMTIGDIGGKQALAILEDLKESEDLSVSMAASGQYQRVKVELYGDPDKSNVRSRFRRGAKKD